MSSFSLVRSAPRRARAGRSPRVRSAGIVGLGAHLPERVLRNCELPATLETTDEWIRTRTGICSRRVAASGEASSDLAVPAALQALERAGTRAEEVDLVLVATSSPDHLFPSTACLVQDRIGAARAAAFDVSAACSGFLYGLGVARSFVAAGVYDTVLLICAEAFSRLLDWNDRGTAVLMGDGAGAAVVRPVPSGSGILSLCLGSDGSGADLISVPAGGSRLPANHQTVDRGQHYFAQDGRAVYRFATQIMGDAAEQALQAAGLAVADVDLLVPHQANLRILTAAAARFGFPMEKVCINLDRYGNTSSAGIPIALCEAQAEGRLREGTLVLTVAFGGGLTWGASVMRWL